jgi:hypothetical protein
MGLLSRTRLEIKGGTLSLVLEGPARDLNGAVVGRRLRALARALDLKADLRLG